jgi:hypothetical protein
MQTVIVDIDGTLSKVGDRVKCLQQDKPDWDAFYDRCGEDEPVVKLIEMVNCLRRSYYIVLCTGRRESCRTATQEWFIENNFVGNDQMLMRKNGDKRHDIIVKPEMLENAGIKLSDIAFVLEDRDPMVKKWREMGLICLQVADGNF